MSYEPFALKYRPRYFADIVGQQAAAETLGNALRTGRIANAFLFSGSRGTGKTSMARILAKALNCPAAKDGEPCGTCEACEAIARGEDLDVIEIDGASNRGIDEIRSIRDSAGYSPSRGQYKVYIIDEVHMLTIQAFNALLKTLEEPPAHVRFIFATTEPQAVPETIVSRCQRYEFRRISDEDLVSRLCDICEKEGVETEPGVLEEIAARGEGGLRDAIGLLDQAAAFGGDHLKREALDRVLGRIGTGMLRDLLLAAGTGAEGAVLDGLDAIFESGRDAEDILAQAVEILRESMVRTARGLRGGGEGRRAELVAEAMKAFDLDRVLLAIRICLNARREIKLVGQGRLQLELAFLKIARSRDLAPVQEILDRLRAGGGVAPGEPRAGSRAPARPPAGDAPPERPASAASGAPRPRPETPPKAAPREQKTARGRPAPPADPDQHRPTTALPPIEVVRAEWGRVLESVRGHSSRIATQIDRSQPMAVEGGTIVVQLAAGQEYARSQMQSGRSRQVFEGALAEVFGHRFPITWTIAQRSAAEGGEGGAPARTVYQDPGVRKILESFEGGVVSIEPEDSE